MRYALRMMRKYPAFAATAILTLALSIGVNTAMFAVVNGVLLRPLPYRESGALVRIALDSSKRSEQDAAFSFTRYKQIRNQARSLSGFGAFLVENYTLSGVAEPEQFQGVRISANFLEVLGVRPQVGRAFTEDEDRPGAPRLVMLSQGLWHRRFGASAGVIGQTITLNSKPYTVIGVMPAGFSFPFASAQIWVTNIAEPTEQLPYASLATLPYLTGFGRLAGSMDQTRAEMDLLNRQYAAAHPGFPDNDPSTKVRVMRAAEQMVAGVERALWTLFGAVGFVLLIACANLASMLLARSMGRTKEFAVRAALGASRRKLIRQLLMESLVLAIPGGALGILTAAWLLGAITAIELPRAGEIRIDGTVLLFTAVVSIGASVLFGILPALRMSRPDLAKSLREHGQVSGTSRRFSAQSLLVVGQVALSIVLLIGAGLMVESFAHLRRVELGFDPSNVLTMRIALPPSRYETDRKKAAFYKDVVQRISGVPGVRGVAVAPTAPTTEGVLFPIQMAGRAVESEGHRLRGQWQSITPGYFRALGIALRRGREFTEHDNPDAPWVVIINEAMARRFWPEYPRGQDPVGQHMLFADNSISAEIVGIAADVHESALAANMGPEAYMPLAQRCLQTMTLMVRTAGDPRRFINSVRAQVLAVDRDQPVADVRTMEDLIDGSISRERLTLLLLGAFSGLALLLAAMGIYGIIAYSVAQRAHELAIRRALGAQSSDIFALVMRQGMELTMVGLAIGITAAAVLTRLMSGLLFRVSATDPATYAAVALLFVMIASAASFIPARRAVRMDALR